MPDPTPDEKRPPPPERHVHKEDEVDEASEESLPRERPPGLDADHSGDHRSPAGPARPASTSLTSDPRRSQSDPRDAAAEG